MAAIAFRLYRCIVIGTAAFSALAWLFCLWKMGPAREDFHLAREIWISGCEALGFGVSANLLVAMFGCYISYVCLLADVKRAREYVQWTLFAIFTLIAAIFFAPAVTAVR